MCLLCRYAVCTQQSWLAEDMICSTRQRQTWFPEDILSEFDIAGILYRRTVVVILFSIVYTAAEFIS